MAELQSYRQCQRPCAAVEYISKRCHRFGYLDRLLCTIPESVAFVQSVDSPNISDTEKRRLLLEAMDRHKRQVKEVKSGSSLHSHFLMLYFMALCNDYPVPMHFLDLANHTAFNVNVCSSQNERLYLNSNLRPQDQESNVLPLCHLLSPLPHPHLPTTPAHFITHFEPNTFNSVHSAREIKRHCVHFSSKLFCVARLSSRFMTSTNVISLAIVIKRYEATVCYHDGTGFTCPYVLYDDHVSFNVISDQRHLGESSSDVMIQSLTSALSHMCEMSSQLQ
ncbi:hypothetical protein ACOMHN_047164 [Nucella lapillus]